MGRAYISTRFARVILTLLLLGSMSGFVLGQELHHPVTPIAHAPTIITARTAGSLGASNLITSHSIKNVTHPAPIAYNTTPRHSDQNEQSHHTPHRRKDGNSTSFTQVRFSPISPENHSQGDFGGGNGGGSSGGD